MICPVITVSMKNYMILLISMTSINISIATTGSSTNKHVSRP